MSSNQEPRVAIIDTPDKCPHQEFTLGSHEYVCRKNGKACTVREKVFPNFCPLPLAQPPKGKKYTVFCCDECLQESGGRCLLATGSPYTIPDIYSIPPWCPLEDAE